MPRENVEVVRQAIEAIRSDDIEADIERLVALSDPGVEFRSVLAAVEGATYRGHEGIRRYFSDLADSWQEWQNEPEEAYEIRPDTVFANCRFTATGKDSGAAVEAHAAVVFVLTEGRLLRVHSYATREEALEAASLRE